MGILPVTQLHCVPCGLARGQSLDQTRKFKMGPKTFQKSTQVFFTKKPYLLTYKQLQTSVSNGTGQCNFSGQRDRSSFIVPGQVFFYDIIDGTYVYVLGVSPNLVSRWGEVCSFWGI